MNLLMGLWLSQMFVGLLLLSLGLATFRTRASNADELSDGEY